MISSAPRSLLTLCALRHEDKHLDWSLIARESLRPDGIDALLAGEVLETSLAADQARHLLPLMLKERPRAEGRVAEELQLADTVGARLVTVIDDDYPTNLLLIPNLPPFLFVRGNLHFDDARSVAVVGTRKASAIGLARAGRIARELASKGVTVVSGLAAGIDTASHRAALAEGGRTIAVIGTGIIRCYPTENERLAEDIVDAGSAIVSQFWPSTRPAKYTFPRRNVVTSGISQGTVVVEASSTSGAKMQARLALEHGKRVFLLHSLVTDQPWARRYVSERGAVEVEKLTDILDWIADAEKVHQVTAARSEQLTLL